MYVLNLDIVLQLLQAFAVIAGGLIGLYVGARLIAVAWHKSKREYDREYETDYFDKTTNTQTRKESEDGNQKER